MIPIHVVTGFLGAGMTLNPRAEPLVGHRAIVDLVGAATSRTGSTVRRELDENVYPKGVVVSNEQMASLNITHADFLG